MSRSLVVVVALAVAGCQPPPVAPFPLHVTAFSDEGVALANLAVKADGALIGRTDAAGALAAELPGRDAGRRVRISIETPAGYRPLADSKVIVVERLTARDDRRRAVPLALDARFAPLVRHYAVLVDAGVAGLPIEVFGVRTAVTNGSGTAMFLTRGAPGDTVEVRVTNGGRRDLKPAYRAETFTLPDTSEAFVLDASFDVIKKRVPAPIKAKRL